MGGAISGCEEHQQILSHQSDLERFGDATSDHFLIVIVR
jgi:hypothetical protein